MLDNWFVIVGLPSAIALGVFIRLRRRWRWPNYFVAAAASFFICLMMLGARCGCGDRRATPDIAEDHILHGEVSDKGYFVGAHWLKSPRVEVSNLEQPDSDGISFGCASPKDEPAIKGKCSSFFPRKFSMAAVLKEIKTAWRNGDCGVAKKCIAQGQAGLTVKMVYDRERDLITTAFPMREESGGVCPLDCARP